MRTVRNKIRLCVVWKNVCVGQISELLCWIDCGLFPNRPNFKSSRLNAIQINLYAFIIIESKMKVTFAVVFLGFSVYNHRKQRKPQYDKII